MKIYDYGALREELGKSEALPMIIAIVLFLLTGFIGWMLNEDILTYTAPDIPAWMDDVYLPLVFILFLPTAGKPTPKRIEMLIKQKRTGALIGAIYSIFFLPFFLPLFVFSTFLWANYIGSDSETRHTELVTVEYFGTQRIGGYEMTVRFKNGCQRTVDMGIRGYDCWEKCKKGTKLPVTIERGLFGIDVIVEWGFENDEHTILLPDKHKNKGR